MDAALRCLLLQNLQWELDIHVQRQNRLDRKASFRRYIEGIGEMREVAGLTAALKSTVQKLRTAHLQATQQFEAEVARSTGNLAKVGSFTSELAAANTEMEAVLADTGSNFPPSSQPSTASPPDINGVTLNKG